jgi:hypothetical protein
MQRHYDYSTMTCVELLTPPSHIAELLPSLGLGTMTLNCYTITTTPSTTSQSIIRYTNHVRHTVVRPSDLVCPARPRHQASKTTPLFREELRPHTGWLPCRWRNIQHSHLARGRLLYRAHKLCGRDESSFPLVGARCEFHWMERLVSD